MTDLSFINAENAPELDTLIDAIMNDPVAYENQRDSLADAMLQLFADSTSDQPDLIRSMLLGETIGLLVGTFADTAEDSAKLEAFRSLVTVRAGIVSSDLTQNPLLTAIAPEQEGARLTKIITDQIQDVPMLGVVAATLVNTIVTNEPAFSDPLRALINGVLDDAPLQA